jgi:hypothetical protein
MPEPGSPGFLAKRPGPPFTAGETQPKVSQARLRAFSLLGFSHRRARAQAHDNEKPGEPGSGHDPFDETRRKRRA